MKKIRALFVCVALAALTMAASAQGARGPHAVFTFAEGDTVWRIWSQLGTTDWPTFYEAVAQENPRFSSDRFSSVPIGASIEIPTSILRIDLVTTEVATQIVAENQPLETAQSLTELHELIDAQAFLLSSLHTRLTALQNDLELRAGSIESSIGELGETGRPVVSTLELVLLLIVLLLFILLFIEKKRSWSLEKRVEDFEGELQHTRDFDETEVWTRGGSFAIPRVSDLEHRVVVLEEELRQTQNSLAACGDQVIGLRRGLERSNTENDRLRSENERLSALLGGESESHTRPTRHGSTHGKGRRRNTSPDKDEI